ncbi:MAG: hypothetical protein LQ350_005999 [Teloschistes chrysophthalmus]|nr:MAG: hypothetical protein LQ350_005999 [Niorma chrysophthalma]
MSIVEMLERPFKEKWYIEDAVRARLSGQARPTPPPTKSWNSPKTTKCFQLMKLPFDLRRSIYEVMYPTNSTLYLTMGSQAIRYPKPIAFRVDKGFVNLLGCCKTIQTEIYQVLYGTNKFVLNPELPDLQFSSQAPHHPKVRQLECYWKKFESTMKAGGGETVYRAVGILPPDQERGEASKSYLWYSRDCFLKFMSPATCAMTRELQIFLGDAEWPYQLVWPYIVPENYHYPLSFFSRVVVTSIPLLNHSGPGGTAVGQIAKTCRLQIIMWHQQRQRSLLREARRRIARARTGRGVTVWDNLGESSCGGFILEVGIGGFSYQNLPENRRWFMDYVHYVVQGHPIRALPAT